MNRPLGLGLAVVGLLAILAGAAPLLTDAGWIGSPAEVRPGARLAPPAPGRWFGTDDVGRDVLARLLHGARPSLLVAILATGVALALGVPAGALAGVRCGTWDVVLTRLMEATGAIPALPLVLLVVSLTLGGGETATAATLALAIGATRWASIARYVRGGVARAAGEEFAAAAVAMGAGRVRLLARHLLPGALAPALVAAAFGAGSAVLVESALSFLGLGTQPPLPSWGRMVADSARNPQAWWLLVAPGLAIAALVAGFNLLAEGVRRGTAAGPPGREAP